MTVGLCANWTMGTSPARIQPSLCVCASSVGFPLSDHNVPVTRSHMQEASLGGHHDRCYRGSIYRITSTILPLLLLPLRLSARILSKIPLFSTLRDSCSFLKFLYYRTIGKYILMCFIMCFDPQAIFGYDY